MIDAQLNKILEPFLSLCAKKLSKFNINPNAITLIGFVFGLFCGLLVLDLFILILLVIFMYCKDTKT